MTFEPVRTDTIEELGHSKIVKKLLSSLIHVLRRRISSKFALETVKNVVEKTKLKYDFFEYIDFQDAMYSEREDAIVVKEEMNKIETKKLGKAIDELFDVLIESLDRDIGFYFIREIEQDFKEVVGPILNRFGVDLEFKQKKYIKDSVILGEKITIRKIKNSEILEITANALIDTLKKLSTKYANSIDIVNKSLNDLKTDNKHNILNYLEIKKKDGFSDEFDIKIDKSVDSVLSQSRGQNIQNFIKEIGTRCLFHTRRKFVKTLEVALSSGNIYKMKTIGVDFEEIESLLRKQGHENLTKKTLKILIEILSEQKSVEYAINFISNRIEELKINNQALNYVKIENINSSNFSDAIKIVPDIDAIDSNDLGKALQNLVIKTQQLIKKENYHSILDDFKAKMGKEYLAELDDIGFNMSIIEMNTR